MAAKGATLATTTYSVMSPLLSQASTTDTSSGVVRSASGEKQAESSRMVPSKHRWLRIVVWAHVAMA